MYFQSEKSQVTLVSLTSKLLPGQHLSLSIWTEPRVGEASIILNVQTWKEPCSHLQGEN